MLKNRYRTAGLIARLPLVLVCAAGALLAQTGDSVSPASGTGSAQIFTVVYSDTGGASAFNRRLLLINSSLNGAGACFVQVDSNGTYLVSDSGAALLGPLPAIGSLANSQCVLSGAGVRNTGNRSTITLSLAFKAAFVGAKNIYGYAEDTSGHNSGFVTLGTFNVVPDTGPKADSVTPSSGTGMAQLFTARSTRIRLALGR